MGTEVDCKSSFEGYYSMRDVNEDSNSSSWPLFYGEKSLSNSHYYNGFISRPISDDKDALKQKMLEHEAIFKNQVHELHRLYIRQRDMMEEVKRKELNKHHNSIDASSSSSFLPSQKPYEDNHNHNHKWQMPTFPCSRPSIFGAEISNSPLSCSKGNNNNNIIHNDHSSKDCEIVECRPSKVRKKLFDLELPPDENMENEEYEGMQCKQVSEESSFRGSNGLADLNEPVVHGFGPSAKPHMGQFFDQRHEFSGRPGGVFNPILVEGKGNGRDWLSNTHETGNSRSNMNFTPGTYSEISRIQDHAGFNQTHHLPFPISRASTTYPHANSSNFGSSWEKANGSSLTHKLTSFQKQQQQPSLLSSPQSHVVVGDRWQQTNGYNNNINNNYNNNIPNGFYRGSSSGSKEPCARFPSSVLDDSYRSQKIFRGSNFIDLMESTKGMDLNTVEETVSNRCNQSVFPWLQSKPAICKNDSLLVNNRRFPGFENSCVSENVKIKKEVEPRGFDINVAWDDDDDDDPENKQIDDEDCKMGKEIDTENEKIKNHFDLNSCVTEDEEITVPESLKCLKKTTMEIDLEAPAVPETEEDEEEEAIDEVKKLDEELAMVAAEAMVSIFSQPKSTSDVAVCSDDEDKDCLLWFAEVIGNTGGPSCNEVDEYEELTLKLEMTKEQDYMPKPLAPDYFQEPDEAGPSMGPLRPRRGQARRGRPRRDFQRDILPGLVSLSRHEVTEDLQIFGGLMRATGHSWNVGLTRRNGTRGRRKSVVVAVDPPPPASTPPPPPPPLSEQLGNLEVVGLDERSLTGWGKTTRRPRRQRCGTGNSLAVPLT